MGWLKHHMLGLSFAARHFDADERRCSFNSIVCFRRFISFPAPSVRNRAHWLFLIFFSLSISPLICVTKYHTACPLTIQFSALCLLRSSWLIANDRNVVVAVVINIVVAINVRRNDEPSLLRLRHCEIIEIPRNFIISQMPAFASAQKWWSKSV